MRRLLVVSTAVFVALCSLGCTASYVHAPIQVLITNVFNNSTVQVGDAAITLQAQVLNDPHNGGVKWSLSVANTGCSPGCGTLVVTGPLSAKYTPPGTAPLNQQATISAAAVDDPNQTYAFTFTILPPTSVQIQNKFASIVAGNPPVTVNAQVNDDQTNSGVTWTLTAGNNPCSPQCGTLVASAAPSFAAQYTPPPTVPNGANANPTITATSVAKTSASDSFAFTITSPQVLLKGTYIFLLRGYDWTSGSPMAMAGSLTADGNGNITAGVIDADNGGGITAIPSATGTYLVDNSFNGVTKGMIEISSFHFPNSTIDLKFRFALSGDQQRGHIIEEDGSTFINSGTIQLQSPAVASAAVTGNFAFGLDSDSPISGRTVAVGQLTFGAAGIAGGNMDQSKAGDPSPPIVNQAIAPGALTTPDAQGRGTLVVNVSAATMTLAYYVVDADHLKLIEIDHGTSFGTVHGGTAVRQKGLTASSINATSVLQLTGMDVQPGTDNPEPDVIIGVFTVTNGNAFSLTFDINDMGAVVREHSANGAIVSFDPATGRAVLSAPGDFQGGFLDSAVFYLYDQGAGFFIDTDISTPNGAFPPITNNAFSGTLTPQSTAGFSGIRAISGNLVAGFGASASSSIPNWDLAFNFDPATGTYTAYGELNSLPSQDGAAINAHFAGTYSLLNNQLGYGFMTMPAAVFGDFVSHTTVNATFYVIAPNQFVLIGANNGQLSGVAFFDPQ